MESFYLGIDVAKAKLDCVLLSPNGKWRGKIGVTNSPEGFAELAQWLDAPHAGRVHACMAATGVYWEAIAESLANAGHTVSVVNPAQIESFGQSCPMRCETDKIDAHLIACFCAERHPEAWPAPSPRERTLKARQAMRFQELNRVEATRQAVHDEGIVVHIEWLDGQIKSMTLDRGNSAP